VKKLIVTIVAVVLLAMPMTASAASFGTVGSRGDAPVVRTFTPDTTVGLYRCYVIHKQLDPLLAMPVSRAMVYLALLGWSGTWDEWLALGWYGQCVWYMGQVPGYGR
jgi:hypothetical protein